MQHVREVWIAFLNLLLPQCTDVAMFDALPEEGLAPLAQATKLPYSFSVVAPFPYKHRLIRSAVHAAKYHGHKRAAVLLGTVLAPYVAEELAERQAFGGFVAPLFIALPLHPERFHERGFNQAERIGTALCVALGTQETLDHTALVRTKHTPPQAHTHSREERLRHMRGAFSVPCSKLVKARDVVLVDDVITTGATLGSARSALLKAGARSVLCVAAAH